VEFPPWLAEYSWTVLYLYRKPLITSYFISGTAFVQFKAQKDAEKFRVAAEDEEVWGRGL
jgi:hypothetical protein